MDKYWLPQKAGRLIAVSGGEIEVLSETGKCYTTDPQPAPGEYYVPDANLLCQYVSEQVEESVLQDAATLQAEEISAREKLLGLETEVRRLSDSLGQCEKSLRIQDANVIMFSDKFEAARKVVGSMCDNLYRTRPLVGWWQRSLSDRIEATIQIGIREMAGAKEQ